MWRWQSIIKTNTVNINKLVKQRPTVNNVLTYKNRKRDGTYTVMILFLLTTVKSSQSITLITLLQRSSKVEGFQQYELVHETFYPAPINENEKNK